mgnify:CR=1 FL=1
MHTVEDGCLEIHSTYIKSTYDVVPDTERETNTIKIDPGGMALIDGDKSSITMKDGTVFEINNEHITSAVLGYFSLEILSDAVDRYHGFKDLSSGYTVRLLEDNVVKVYLPYNILVMNPDTYMDLAGELERLYLKGFNAYLELAASMPDEYFMMGLADGLGPEDIGEA